MTPKAFVVYKSSAGSGKTYTLVKEYLKIILEDPQKVRNILAITFTNAAAAEMKERVVEALGQLSELSGENQENWSGKGKGLLQVLGKEVSLEPFEIIRRARMALTLILHNYGDFSISTIDSFVHRIIRSFAFDLHLPLNFDVELDKDQLLSQAVDILVSRAGTHSELTQLLVQYIESRTDEEKSHYIEYEIAQLANTLMDEKGTVYIEKIKNIPLAEFGKIHTELTRRIGEYEKSIAEVARKALHLMSENGLHADMFYRGKTGIANYFTVLASGAMDKVMQPNSYVLTTLEQDKWTSAKADAEATAIITSLALQFKDIYGHIQQIAEQGHSHYQVQKLIRQNLFPMAVLSELEKVIDEIKTDNSLLHISDFNKKISEVVSVETAPFIYERIGERYQHYMIDEFQDTSGLQWQNLLPLIDNSLASANLNLVVGDGKQAIYRWRNGDVEQFAALPRIPVSVQTPVRDLWQATLERNYREEFLDTNYRSRSEIISFNNGFFEFAKGLLPEELQKIYLGQTQKSRPDKPGGFVQMEFVEPEQQEESSYYEKSQQRILEIILDLRQKGHPLNDITILCRANKDASNTARFLLENGLNVISSESLLLNQSPAVNFVVSIMKLMNNPADATGVVEFLQYLVKSKKLEDTLPQALAALKENENHRIGPSKTLEVLEKYLLQNGIRFSFAACKHLGLYEMTENIVRHFFAGEAPNPFIAFFMDVVYEYTGKFVSSASGFLEWWADKSGNYSVVVPEGVDAVQVMTIHKSKGLQFPVVIYPFVDMGFGKASKKGQWVELDDVPGAGPLDVAWIRMTAALQSTPYADLWEEEMGKTLLDTLNVVYVAFTRAAEKLFILSKYPGKTSKGDNMPALLITYLEQAGLLSPGQDTYSFGENFTPRKSELPATDATGEQQTIFDEYISTPWSHKVSIRSQQLSLKADDSAEESVERGSRIHEIMEKIHTPGDVDRILNQMLQAGIMEEEEKTLLQEKITGLLGHPDLAPWYRAGLNARNECGMYDEKGCFFRADRVVLEKDTAVVIDYKTGEPYPHHYRQVDNYAEVIKQMGFTTVKKCLVYIDQGRVELV